MKLFLFPAGPLVCVFLCIGCSTESGKEDSSTDTDTDTDTDSDTDIDTDSDTDIDTDSDTDIDTDSDTDIDTDSDTDTDADSDTDADADSDTDADADMDADTDSDSDTDTHESVVLTVDSSANRLPISPYIYGSNQPDWQGEAAHLTMERLGGNRWTAYNWETNASNAGSDWYYSNDSYLIDSDIPGEAVRSRVQAAYDAGAATIVTVPIAGYVSADKNGYVDLGDPNHLADRFLVSYAEKGSSFDLSPDTADDAVYQDEFVNRLVNEFPNATLFYALDNEPDLWAYTHEEIHPDPVTYSELVERSIDYSAAIKSVDPEGLVFGFVSYGWNGFIDLQAAPDSEANGDFINYFLDKMQQAETDQGRRLVDVLDLHWYPEAMSGGNRITDDNNSAAMVEARIQAPRSLWDPTYVEESWVADYLGGQPIALLPRVKAQIADHYPDTRLAITEYNYGGYGHISGGIAEADVLGIFGREGVFAAALWHLSDDQSFNYAAFDMYRNFDGQGGTFGDTSVAASTSDAEKTSFYAGMDADDENRMVLAALNKTEEILTGEITISHTTSFANADVYLLDETAAAPRAAGSVSVTDNRFTYNLPPMSVSTIELTP